MTIIFNKKQMTLRRKELRNNMTKAESLLWERIRKNQLHGVRFRRQVSIGAYVVDFYSSRIKLAIEVDGPTHDSMDAQEYDTNRAEYIKQIGVQVLRFRNEEIYTNIEYVVQEIDRFASQLRIYQPPIIPLRKGDEQQSKVSSL